MPPYGATLSTTHLGFPSEVTKKRTPSSSAMSIHSTMRSWYFLDAFSISAFMPIGLEVRRRMYRSPSRKS